MHVGQHIISMCTVSCISSPSGREMVVMADGGDGRAGGALAEAVGWPGGGVEMWRDGGPVVVWRWWSGGGVEMVVVVVLDRLVCIVVSCRWPSELALS